MRGLSKVLFLFAVLVVVGCAPKKGDVEKLLKDHPEILVEAIKANPGKIMIALQEAATGAKDEIQKEMAKKREEEEKKELDEALKNPLKADIAGRIVRGNPNGAIELVEYSDFECPYCTRGFQTVNAIMEKYQGQVKFVYKHLPLSFHPQAKPAAIYFEAIALQSEEKAWKFHDAIFNNQPKLKNGDSFLSAEAKKLNIDMAKLAKDLKSKEIADRIEKDIEEAGKFDIQGTPGFLINGVPVRGAYPPTHFYDIIAKLQEMGTLKL